MNLSDRWRSLRTQASLPNAIIALAVVAIVVFAFVDAVRRGYLSANTAIFLACFVPAVICHEVSHGIVAYWCGDDTAKRAGRLTANPLKHVDPFGSIILPIIMVLTVHIPFGYAKPVPVAINRLRHPRNQAVLVGLAGPVTNIILAAIAGVVIHILFVSGHVYTDATQTALAPGFEVALDFGLVNIILAAFNLIPIPPLDGSSVVERLLPSRWLPQYYQMRFFFMIIVLLLVVSRSTFLTGWLDSVENWYINLFT